jgi:hypothetical protein
VEFDAVNFLQERVGIRYATAWAKNEIYVGAAYDYKFGGKAKIRAMGVATDAPSLKGGTGIGEIGIVHHQR